MQNDDRYHELFEIADKFFKNGQLNKAEKFAVDTLKDNPKFAPAFQLLMMIFREQGFEEEALSFQKFRKPLYIPIPGKLKSTHFKDYCQVKPNSNHSEHNYKKTVLGQEERTKLSPVSQTTKKHSRFFNKSYLNSAPVEQYLIHEGKIWEDGFNQIIWDKDRKLIPELCRGHAELVDYIVQTRKPERYEGKVAVIANRIPDNYYHWFTDVLPALHIIEKSGLTNDEIAYYLLNPIELGYQRDSLRRYDIPESKQIVHNRQTYLEADQLIICRWGSNSLGAQVGSWLSEELKSKYQIESQDLKCKERKNIYISRGQTATRRIINEPQLTDLLANKYGFLIVDPCDHSIAEQANLFSNAKYIVAAHGAALTNLHFCNEGTKVFEIFGDYVDPCFWILCNRLGIDHYFHQPDQHRLSPSVQTNLGERRKSDIYVDVDVLENDLKKTLTYV